MAEGFDQLREEQRRIVGRIMRIIAIGTLVGAIFFLYTEFVMTMEQTRQWLLSDVPRDVKVDRALGEKLPAGACADVSAALEAARTERDAAVADCHAEHAALAASAASAEGALRASLQSLESDKAAQVKAIAARDAQIKSLREQLTASSAELQGFEEDVAEPEEGDGAAAGILKRWSAARNSKRRIKVTAAKAFFDERTGLSVSLREFSDDYSADVRIEAPGLGTVTDEMAPGQQHNFSHDGVRYTLVLLATDPERGDAEFSLVGRSE